MSEANDPQAVTPAVGAFPINLVDSPATAFAIEGKAGWYDFGAKAFAAGAFDAAKHAAPVVAHPAFPNVKRIGVPAGIHANPFTVYALKGAIPVQAFDFGAEGIPWASPTVGVIKLG